MDMASAERGSWYLLRCKHNQEKRVVNNLHSLESDCFVPLMRVAKKKGGFLIEKVEPLFPGYVFFYDDGKVDWQSLKFIRGVQSVVQFGMSPCVVPNSVIEEIKARRNHVLHIDEQPLNAGSGAYVEGEPVSIINGCFSGLTAIYKCKLGRERSIILMNILGVYSPIKMDDKNLRRASPAFCNHGP